MAWSCKRWLCVTLVSSACGSAPAHADEGAIAAASACVKLGLRAVTCGPADDAPFDPRTSRLVLGPSEVEDPVGLRRDVYYFLGWQLAIVGILYVSPESVSGWSEEQKDNVSFSEWWNHVTHPRWDGDDFFINYVMHPYWGGTYFVRARERGYGNRAAFWYSALLSSLYEFGVESFFENPSYQDLIVTPVGGSVVGVGFMRVRAGIRERIAREGRYRHFDRWWLVLTDPLGTVNRFTDRVLGVDSHVVVHPVLERSYDSRADHHDVPIYGVRLAVFW